MPASESLLRAAPLDYNLFMRLRRLLALHALWLFCLLGASGFPSTVVHAQQPSPASVGRILLLPRTIVSGERATLAVLDVNGRLAPREAITFSNGDRVTTDATGRALWVAPLTPGVIFGSIAGRPGRVPVTILSSEESASPTMRVDAVPQIASLTDRFEIAGRGFCGDADANQITISGAPAFVLASSPTSLVLLPPPDLPPGRASVDLSCAKRNGPPLEVVFVALALEADFSPLAPGIHRTIIVRVSGTAAKLTLEARNLAPDVADLTGGNPQRTTSSGGAENVARFEIIGRKRGSFLISIRLLNPRSTAQH